MKRRKAFAVLPTLLTLGNAACGFGAITIAARVGPESLSATVAMIDAAGEAVLESTMEQRVAGNELFVASLLVFLAMLFDMLDGSAARWTKQTSEFGAQLDSLCDALSFGAAPAFLMLQFTHPRHHLIEGSVQPLFVVPSRLLWVIAALFVVCTLLRLARFNVETDDDDSHEYFSGLPSPAAAGTIAAFPIAIRGLNQLAEGPASPAHYVSQWSIAAIAMLLPLITLAVAFLMVSRIRYSHVFNQLFHGRRSRTQLLQLVFGIALIFLVREMAIPMVFCYFAFGAPARAIWTELVMHRLSRSTTASRNQPPA